MSIRATARLYLTADSALVTENDPAGRTLYCNPGDEISDADLGTINEQKPDGIIRMVLH